MLLLLAGCDAGQSAKARHKPFVPPPVRPVAPPQAPEELSFPEFDPQLAVTPPPRVDPTAPTLPRTLPPQAILARAERQFNDGKRALQEGKPTDARRSFDQAIQTLMSEPLPENAAARRRMEERLADMTDAIYHYDLEQLGAGLGDPASEETATSIEKQILEETLPVNPVLRERVREQIEMTMSQLPLEVTDAVVGYINYFSTERGRRVLLSGFARAGKYREMIHRTFAGTGLPEELIFVAQLESHFNPTAVSYARAVGMWQFMSYTAPSYSLAINKVLDERRDPERATYAASQYLLELYRHYGDWYLALAAYNCGPGCVDRAIQRTGYSDFWELRRLRALPLATTNYVPEVLAMTIMYKNAEEYGIAIEEDPALEYDNLVMEQDTNLALVAAAVDRPVGQIKELNPALLQSVAPAGYSLHLPVGSVEVLQAAFEIVPPAQRKTARIHRVEESDTWASIAKKYATTAAKLTALNSEELPAVGNFAMIPPAPAPAPKAAPKPAAKPAKTPAKPPAKSPPANSKASAKPAPRAGA